MLPIYKRLSDPKLLERCLPGYTQNQNESFNHLIWIRRPKEVHVGPKAVCSAVASAVIHWNSGASGRESIMRKMGLNPGTHTRTIHDRKDRSRIERSKRAAAESEKEKRKLMKLKKIVLEEQKTEKEGETYSAGGF